MTWTGRECRNTGSQLRRRGKPAWGLPSPRRLLRSYAPWHLLLKAFQTGLQEPRLLSARPFGAFGPIGRPSVCIRLRRYTGEGESDVTHTSVRAFYHTAFRPEVGDLVIEFQGQAVMEPPPDTSEPGLELGESRFAP